MDSRANVKSLEAIEDFAKALLVTQSDLTRISELVRIELDKVTSYLEKESPDYWKHQHRRAQEKLEVARNALSRCQQVTRAGDEKSCLVEKKQVAIAKQPRRLLRNKTSIPKIVDTTVATRAFQNSGPSPTDARHRGNGPSHSPSYTCSYSCATKTIYEHGRRA